MNKYESNKMNSFFNAEEMMVRNESVWKADQNVENIFKLIQLKLPDVNKFHQAQKKNGNTASVVKSGLKNELIGMAVKISASAVSYAVSQKDAVLEMGVKVTKSNLQASSQIRLYDTLMNFSKKVTLLNGSLTHLDPGDIDKLGELIQAFKASIPKPGADSDELKTATLNIGETIKQLNEMFSTLDKHLAPYAYLSPDFFNDYTNSRKMVNLKGKGKKKKEYVDSTTN
jgi:hypothetical protein